MNGPQRWCGTSVGVGCFGVRVCECLSVEGRGEREIRGALHNSIATAGAVNDSSGHCPRLLCIIVEDDDPADLVVADRGDDDEENGGFSSFLRIAAA